MATKKTVQLFFDAVLEKADWPALLADDVVFISAASPLRQVSGKAAALPGLRRFYSMVSTFSVREIIVDADKACALTRYTLQPPSGGPTFTSDVAEIFTVRNDKITSFAIYFDTAPYPK
jgi:ketosteroid isomerase-like protein